MNLFCGDCERFRTNNCINVWLIGLVERCNDGNVYWLHYPKDEAADSCEYYEEKETPKYRLNHEEETRREQMKYGEMIIWL